MAAVDADRFAVEASDLHRRLVRVVYLLAGDDRLAEDAAQEALLRAWERVDRGESLHSLAAWTTTVALNWTRSQLRRRGAEHRALSRAVRSGREVGPVETSAGALEAPATGPGTPAGLRTSTDDGPVRDRGLSREVVHALASLPLRQREVVVLHYLLDQDVATIARSAGISAGAVKNALFHARRRLARTLDPAGPDADAAGPTPSTLGEEHP